MGIRDEFYANNDPLRVPNPSHRHAAPSGPWPWVDLGDEFDRGLLDSELPPVPPLCDHTLCGGSCWKSYPESRFPNWTERQVEKCEIQRIIKKRDLCRLYVVDVDKEGMFTIPPENGVMEVTQKNIEQSWKAFVANERPRDLRVRAVFIEDLSGPVLQMLGAKFNIEPFFWSSSLNWIPTRFQEDPQAGKGDHITICLTFLRATLESDFPQPTSSMTSTKPSTLSRMMIDTQAPLPLSTGHLLVLDFLSVHMIRNSEGSTIISYHPSQALSTTKAHDLHQRIELAGRSVYWQKMFQISSDPTFVMLIFLWHAMYAWDEAMENLYTHICKLETDVIETNEMHMTSELHVIRAHQLHYHELLEHFRKSVEFVMKYPNPTYDNASEQERKLTKDLLERECNQLLAGINRLEMSRKLQDKRLKNVMNLVFSSVNLDDSRRMQRMTEAAVRDSSAMKQIAYMTMVFLPASFVAAVFGMNVKEISEGTQGTLPHYVVAAAGMTIATVWIIMAYQCQHFLDADYGFLMRLLWPILFILKLFKTEKLGKAKNGKKGARGGSNADKDIEMQARHSFYPSRDRAASAP